VPGAMPGAILTRPGSMGRVSMQVCHCFKQCRFRAPGAMLTRPGSMGRVSMQVCHCFKQCRFRARVPHPLRSKGWGIALR